MRWACTGCRRLLSHEHFDNHSILRLAYRKPACVTSAHELPVTSWGPSLSHLHIPKTKRDAAQRRDRNLRQQYFICVTEGRGNRTEDRMPVASQLHILQDCEIEGFQRVTQPEFDNISHEEMYAILQCNARQITAERAGYKRHLRKCNECRYQLGVIPLHPSPGVHGTAEMPVIASRQVSCSLHIDRWLPGLSARLDSKRPLAIPSFRVDKWDARPRLYTLFMARCPRCARWQELREFRIAGTFEYGRSAQWGGENLDNCIITPEALREASCNACFEKENGREKLSEALLQWVDFIIWNQLESATHFLLQAVRGWNELFDSYTEYRDQARAMAEHALFLRRKGRNHTFTYLDIAPLKLLYLEWDEMMWRMDAEDNVDSFDFYMWDHAEDILDEGDFDKWEAIWRWFVAVRLEVRDRPDVLVEWALERSRSGVLS